MRIIVLLSLLVLSACSGADVCEREARAAVPTFANSIGDMVVATEVEQRCLAR